ncbi:hypothetical protein CAPTEDRAFT_220273 [Capitella teleta]|uniref:Ankyrin repeat domain-containing protein n=1 Tax=Capitella teleta TaxID=283909 RepID=R7U8W0_CAPTE|nr:hypothetical protein CAPTEDRAFT_220273 [Capitella teleta]|eukprot:ELU00132.1 hypothetical protein CAPTEDRAFT_220273 [Capitella teleta]
MSTKWIEEAFPLHWLVWHNEFRQLEDLLTKEQPPEELEKVDPRGRSPLHLAVALGHVETVKVLLKHGASANAENSRYWAVVQEAVATGDPEMVQLCLKYRNYQRYNTQTAGVPELLQKLRDAADFYVEMKWEFASWVPLVSRMCPSDTYRVWKRGSNVRIDTTLLGFDNMNWQRGSRSYVFRGDENATTVMEIDHDACQVHVDTMQVQPDPLDIALLAPTEDQVAARITSPIVTTYIDVEKISFERSKSGIWGWRSDKAESVNQYECKVFSASNVELVTKTRTEHLTDKDKQKMKKSSSRSPLESFLGMASEQEQKTIQGASNVQTTSYNPCHISPEEYFNAKVSLEGRDIGRPIEQTQKTQKFKAQLWLSENYPLSLPEQVAPIIDLMAASNAHFRKLKDFITLQLPAGFPVKIEIPLFHVLNARITFGNIFASDATAPGVTHIPECDGTPMCCSIEESCFDAPTTYSVLGELRGPHPSERLRDEDDQLLQFAIQQSLVETGTENEEVTLYEALNKTRPTVQRGYIDMQSEEERLLQQAIEQSIQMSSQNSQNSDIDRFESTEGSVLDPEHPINTLPPASLPLPSVDDDQLRLALELSQQEQDYEKQRRQQEEEELEMILRLSLTEK